MGFPGPGAPRGRTWRLRGDEEDLGSSMSPGFRPLPGASSSFPKPAQRSREMTPPPSTCGASREAGPPPGRGGGGVGCVRQCCAPFCTPQVLLPGPQGVESIYWTQPGVSSTEPRGRRTSRSPGALDARPKHVRLQGSKVSPLLAEGRPYPGSSAGSRGLAQPCGPRNPEHQPLLPPPRGRASPPSSLPSPRLQERAGPRVRTSPPGSQGVGVSPAASQSGPPLRPRPPRPWGVAAASPAVARRRRREDGAHPGSGPGHLEGEAASPARPAGPPAALGWGPLRITRPCAPAGTC